MPRPTFVAEVTALAATESWVVEWQYDQVRSLLLARADLLVWLDLSRTRVFAQLLSRTVVRRVRRVELWNGNHEPPLHTIFTDPEHVVRWAWGSYARIGPRVQDVLSRPDPPRSCGCAAVGRSGGGSRSWRDRNDPDVSGIRSPQTSVSACGVPRGASARAAPVASPRTTVRGGSGGCGCSVSTRG